MNSGTHKNIYITIDYIMLNPTVASTSMITITLVSLTTDDQKPAILKSKTINIVMIRLVDQI